MSNDRRCRSVHTHAGWTYRCQDVEGHRSAHYDEDLWWPNEVGLPERNGTTRMVGIVTCVAVALLLAGIIYWILR